MFCLLLTLSLFVRMWAVAPQDDADNRLTERDFENMYQIVNKNITTFNTLNESLLGDYTQDEWVDIYLDRAKKTYDLLQENQKVINSLFSKLKNPACAADFEHIILRTNQVRASAVDDNFLAEEILQRAYSLLEPLKYQDTLHMERFMALAVELAAVKQIVSVSGDQEAFRKCYELNKDLIEHYVPGRDVVKTPKTIDYHLRAYNYLVGHKEFIVRGCSTIEEYEKWYKEFDGYLKDSLYISEVPKNNVKAYASTISRYGIGIVRSVFLPDTTHRYDKELAEILPIYVDYYDQNKEKEQSLTITDKRRLNVMRERLGRISTLDALQQGNHFLELLTEKEITDRVLSEKVNCILECVYFIDVSTLSNAEKHDAVKNYCDAILTDLQHFKYDNNTPNLVRSLSHAATYQRIHKYLATEERKLYLETLLFYSQPYTRAHSETVARLALTIFDSVLKHEPALFTGLMGHETTKAIKKNKSQFKEFFRDAARYHDFGKTRMPDIIRNEYRQLTDHEFAIIKLHPALGVEMLRVDPTLMDMTDIVLGHHKWYNGKSGYPASFDNTQSPYRVLIDILTLADCLEAATSKLGRNYRKNKTYDVVLKEFQADAGTRYNPVLVDFLVSHPEVGEKVRHICETGWQDIYYSVFKTNGQAGPAKDY